MSKDTAIDVDETSETEHDTTDMDKAVQAAGDRVRTEYSAKLKEAKAENEELREQLAGSSNKADAEKIAMAQKLGRLEAISESLDKKEQLLTLAVEHDVDPKTALLMVGAADPTAAIQQLKAELEGAYQTGVNIALTRGDPPKSGTLDSHDFSRLTQAEMERLPPSQRERAFLQHAAAVDNNNNPIGAR